MSTPTSVADLGEFGLIARAARVFAAPLTPGFAPGLKIGIGDDAAVWAPTPTTWSVITADALVEGVHFRFSTTDWYDLGWKSLAVNLSDVAAMGASPRYAVLCLGLPAAVSLADVDAFCRGIADVAARYDTALVGGDTVAAPVATISVTVVGETLSTRPGGPPPLLRRDRGRVGDAVAVTGWLGASAGGLRLLESGARTGPGADLSADAPDTDVSDAATALLQAHRRPIPRVAEAALLLQQGVCCAQDLSDGLLGDAQRIAEASDVGVVLEAARVPVSPALAELFPDDALDLALGGGEDYELLCAAPPDVLARAGAALAAAGGPPLTIVGRVVPTPPSGPRVQVVDADGRPRALRGGYTHWT